MIFRVIFVDLRLIFSGPNLTIIQKPITNTSYKTKRSLPRESKSIVFLIIVLCLTAFTFQNTNAQNKNKKITVLIVDGQNNHKWKETTPVLREMLEQSGKFTVDVSTCPPKSGDMNTYNPAFDKYQVIVVNNGFRAERWSRNTELSFEKYMANGGGMVSYHAADNCYTDWLEYNKMIGIGGWGGRNKESGPYLYTDKQGKIIKDESDGKCGSHGKQTEFEITVRDHQHPITKGLPKTFKHGPDELYSHLRGPAENVTILGTAHSPENNRGSGREEPMLMTIQYKKGRAFHTTLGHHIKQIQRGSFVTTFLRGTEWAATGKVTIPAPKEFPDQPYKGKIEKINK